MLKKVFVRDTAVRIGVLVSLFASMYCLHRLPSNTSEFMRVSQHLSLFQMRQPMNCTGVLNGTWNRIQLSKFSISNIENLTVEDWTLQQTSPGPQCNIYGTDTAADLEGLRNRHIYFIGDSLIRNMLNGLVDIIRPDDCGFSSETGLFANGKIVNPNYATYNRADCELNRPSSHDDAEVFVPEYNLTLSMLWIPMYPPWEILEKVTDLSNKNKTYRFKENDSMCRKIAEAQNFLGGGVEKALEYVGPQLNDCTDIPKTLTKLYKNEPEALFVLTQPALSTREQTREYMFTEFPKFLADFKDRVLFSSHLPRAKVDGLVKNLAKLDIPYMYYGDENVVPKELWYDVWHVAGPIQEIIGRLMLNNLNLLAQKSQR